MAEEPGHGEIGSSVRFLKMEDFCLGKKKKYEDFFDGLVCFGLQNLS